MGLPIWRSPPPSPRPSTATLCDVGPTRTSIRRRTSPRTSPRDGAHRFVPMPRSSRATLYPVSRRGSSSMDHSSTESRSSTRMAVSLLNMRLQRLQLEAMELQNQRSQLLTAHAVANEAGRTAAAPSDANDYGVPYAPELDTEPSSVNADYERALYRHRSRILIARQEISRLEDDGLQLNDQRRRLDRLYGDLYDRHAPRGGLSALTPLIDVLDSPHSRDDSEPVPQILSVPERFTSSPQPMHETLASGAVRASSRGSSSTSTGPEMELPPLRRMGDRTVRDRSPPLATTIIEAYTVEEVMESSSPSAFPSGLGDRDRSVEPDEEEDSWHTMLSTIAPDDRLPSASSSFASDAASRSFSASSGSSSRAASSFSTRTGITIPDVGADVDVGRGVRVGDGTGVEGCDTVETWRTIGERFNRGEDVPDELWVNAGVPEDTARILARSMRERL